MTAPQYRPLAAKAVSSGSKNVSDAVAGINAPRRTAEYNGGSTGARDSACV